MVDFGGLSGFKIIFALLTDIFVIYVWFTIIYDWNLTFKGLLYGFVGTTGVWTTWFYFRTLMEATYVFMNCWNTSSKRTIVEAKIRVGS